MTNSRLSFVTASIAGFVFVGLSLGPAFGATDIEIGEQLLKKDCATCHAIGRTGASPVADAPVFRTLGKRYPIDSLEEALGEGIMSGHPDMPEMEYEADQVGAIIEYLKSIQQP